MHALFALLPHLRSEAASSEDPAVQNLVGFIPYAMLSMLEGEEWGELMDQFDEEPKRFISDAGPGLLMMVPESMYTPGGRRLKESLDSLLADIVPILDRSEEPYLLAFIFREPMRCLCARAARVTCLICFWLPWRSF